MDTFEGGIMKQRKTIIGVGILLLIIVLTLGATFEFSIGNRSLSKGFKNLQGDHSMHPDMFNQTGWDGPTGSFTSGEIYALRLGDWLWYLTVTTDGSPKKN